MKKTSKRRIRIPRGWYRLPNGVRKKRGDKFLNQEGQWITTSDWGSKVTSYYPTNYAFPKWTGVYIRREKTT